MVKKTIIVIISIIIIIALVGIAGFIVFNNFVGVAEGEVCGPDGGECKGDLSCLAPEGSGTVYPINPTTGNSFGICGEGSNDRGDADVCRKELIGCCAEGFQCGKFPADQDSFCFRDRDFEDFPDELIVVDDTPCY